MIWSARIIALSLLCVNSSIAMAQSQPDEPKLVDFPGLDIQAVPGWDGHVDLSGPLPFSFLISNFSQDTIEGELTLTNPESDRTLSLGVIFIGPNSVRRFSSIQAVPEWYQCVARFSHEGRVLWQRELALTTGKDFSEDVNYLLFVDDGTRMLQLPINENASGATGRFAPDTGSGRAVQPVAVKTWQIPQHPGPLTVAQAIVFSEVTTVEMLNDAQWDAVGKWICMGGTVFVHEKSVDVIDRLKKATPLADQPAILFEELSVYRCGTGSIREYAGPLFSATDVQTPRQIAESASRLSRCNSISMLKNTNETWRGSRNADITRMWVAVVFVVYTLLSSSALLLFRLSRRNITIFIATVVGLTCVAAIILGGFLRTSRGDLSWVTITTAGPGGLLQVGKIDVQSAGGRNTQMAVTGHDADVQLSESSDKSNYSYGYYYQPDVSQPYFPAFTWQASQLKDQADAYQVNVPINPWGRRQLYATAFQPIEQGVHIEIAYHPPDPSAMNLSEGIAAQHGLNGTFKITATSHLPFDLHDGRFVIARTVVTLTADENGGFYSNFDGRSQRHLPQTQMNVDFGSLSPSMPVIVESSSIPDSPQAERRGRYNHVVSLIPDVAYEGAASIWLVAQISRSPILSIDQQRSDFGPMHEQHWYLQEVLPEQLPQEWLDLTQRLLKEQIKAAADAAPKPTGQEYR
ncbi:MAG: hypothetical protein O2856_06415 [Planctomycetota bacterium]|nr:hypothetical protein [Planctomycetota bacterium]